MRFMKFLWITCALAGCSLAPDYQPPEMNIPEQFTNAPASTATPTSEETWWKAFGSEELVSLITQTQKANNNLLASRARMEQAEALAKVAGGSLFPQLALSGSGGRSSGRGGGNGFFNNSNEGTNGGRGNNGGSTTNYSTTASLSYELDLFSKLRDTANATDATALASHYDRDALRLTTTAQTAEAYGNLLALDERVAIAEQNLHNADILLQVIQTRFDAGAVSLLELSQQQTLRANELATVASLRQQREAAQNMLAVLVGETPESFKVTATSLTGISPPEVAAVLPSELLARRPDIASLEAQLRAANFNIGAARAAFFPSLSLSASFGLSANPSSSSAETITSLMASLSAPLFTGGQLEGNLEHATARQKELAALYRQAVLTAFGEAENALYTVETTTSRLVALSQATDAAKKAYTAARIRFDNGAIDMPTLLTTQSALFNAEDSLAQAKADRLIAATELFKALGGGYR